MLPAVLPCSPLRTCPFPAAAQRRLFMAGPGAKGACLAHPRNRHEAAEEKKEQRSGDPQAQQNMAVLVLNPTSVLSQHVTTGSLNKTLQAPAPSTSNAEALPFSSPLECPQTEKGRAETTSNSGGQSHRLGPGLRRPCPGKRGGSRGPLAAWLPASCQPPVLS